MSLSIENFTNIYHAYAELLEYKNKEIAEHTQRIGRFTDMLTQHKNAMANFDKTIDYYQKDQARLLDIIYNLNKESDIQKSSYQQIIDELRHPVELPPSNIAQLKSESSIEQDETKSDASFTSEDINSCDEFLPSYCSPEFYSKMFTKAISNSTKNCYNFHLKRLVTASDIPTDAEIFAWIESATSSTYKRHRMILGQRIQKIYGYDATKLNDMHVQLRKAIKDSPESQSLKTNAEFKEEYTGIMDKLFQMPINKYTLFGYWLPPRRRDIFTLNVIADVPEDFDIETASGENYYVKSSRSFIYTDFKNKRVQGNQILAVSDLEHLYQPEVYQKICAFLDEMPIGTLFKNKPDTESRTQASSNGFNINSFRHFWARYVTEEHNTKANLYLIGKWMAHSIAVQQTIYRQ